MLGLHCAGTTCMVASHAGRRDPASAQMRCIKLTEEQAASIARMRELYLHNLGALMRRRQELSALLKAREIETEIARRHIACTFERMIGFGGPVRGTVSFVFLAFLGCQGYFVSWSASKGKGSGRLMGKTVCSECS